MSLYKDIDDVIHSSHTDLYNYIKLIESAIEANKANLRDQLAMAALTGILANPKGPAGDWDKVSNDSYEAADAMLKARGE